MSGDYNTSVSESDTDKKRRKKHRKKHKADKHRVAFDDATDADECGSDTASTLLRSPNSVSSVQPDKKDLQIDDLDDTEIPPKKKKKKKKKKKHHEAENGDDADECRSDTASTLLRSPDSVSAVQPEEKDLQIDDIEDDMETADSDQANSLRGTSFPVPTPKKKRKHHETENGDDATDADECRSDTASTLLRSPNSVSAVQPGEKDLQIYDFEDDMETADSDQTNTLRGTSFALATPKRQKKKKRKHLTTENGDDEPTADEVQDSSTTSSPGAEASHGSADVTAGSTKKLPSVCYLCQADVPSTEHYIEHLASAHGIQSYQCPRCNKGNSSKEQLSMHMKVACGERTSQPRLYCCTLCPLRYTFLRDLRRHIKMQHLVQQDVEYKCIHCRKSFIRKDSMLRHQISCLKRKEGKEKKEEQERVFCTVCDKDFASKSSLRYHVNTIHKKVTFNCHCGKVFRWSRDYYAHRKEHDI